MAHINASAQERAAREQLRPERHQLLHIFPTTKSGAPVGRDAANTTDQGVILMAATQSKAHWYDDRETLSRVAAYAEAQGVFRSRADVLEFFREPWPYFDLFVEMRLRESAVAADENRITATLEAVA